MPNPLIHTVRTSVLLASTFLIASCASTVGRNAESTVNPELEAINASIESLRDGLNDQYSKICEAEQVELKRDYDELEGDHAQLKKSLAASQRKYAKLEKRCETKNVVGKLLMGEIENVRLLKEDLTLSARIDTGAETSSLGVFQLQDFERDGKTWVKFKLTQKKSAPTYEYRVSGRARIKQSAESEGDERFEIKMNIGIGNKDYPRQVFNLADRSYLEHPVLIGRSFLTDVAIVDTGSKYRLKK